MRKNNKGFTLIEVLVAITIMGIITVMALPGIQQLQAQNREKKYEKYAESLVSSTKLYVDSNEEDIFGYSVSGCVVIKYKELESKALVKDYETNGVSCAGDTSLGDTYVRVEKKGTKYSYKPFITCTKNGKLEYQTKETVDQCTSGSSGATGSGTLSASITATDESTWTRRKTVTVKISTTSSGLMLSRNNRLNYCMATYDSSTNKYNCVGDKESLSLSLSSNQKEIVLTEEIGSNLSGEYYFVLFPGEGQIADYAGNVLSEDVVSNKLKFDNTAPKITSISETKYFFGTLTVLQINYSNEPAESEISEITYSYDNFSKNEKMICQTLDILGLSKLVSSLGFDLCDVTKNPYEMSKKQFDFDTYDIVYFKITDAAGNSSVAIYNANTGTISYE